MNPTLPDDADYDRRITERLAAEVEDVMAGHDLLERIRASALSDTRVGRTGRPGIRWLLPIAAAAAAVLAVVFITMGGDDDADVATGADRSGGSGQVVLSGQAGGEEWAVVDYTEDDAAFVEEPTACLRFDPAIEDGPFFCGTRDDLVGAHGRLVLRRGARFNDHAVFAGVFAPEVAEVTLRVNGERIVVEPTRWPGRDLGVAVVMLPVPGDVDYGVDLSDANGEWLTLGSSSGGTLEPADAVPDAKLTASLPESSRHLVAVDVVELKASLGLPADHAFVPPASSADSELVNSVGAVLSHLRRPIEAGAAAAIDTALLERVAGNECAVGPECLAVIDTRQDQEDLRRRFLAEGWSAEGGLLVNSGRVADVSYPVVGITPDLVFLGQDESTVRQAIEGRSTPPEALVEALDRVGGPVRRAMPCGDSTAAIASSPGASHQITSQADATVSHGGTVTIASEDYTVTAVKRAENWTIVTIAATEQTPRSLTHLADRNEPSVEPAALSSTFSC